MVRNRDKWHGCFGVQSYINHDFLVHIFKKYNMNKIYYLATCDTCRKIIKTLPKNIALVFHDIKQNPLTEAEVEQLYELSGSYEALFSKKAVLYKTYGLKDKNLQEADFKKYLLEHYTFLSRPVFIINGAIYIGNSQQNILQVHNALR